MKATKRLITQPKCSSQHGKPFFLARPAYDDLGCSRSHPRVDAIASAMSAEQRTAIVFILTMGDTVGCGRSIRVGR